MIAASFRYGQSTGDYLSRLEAAPANKSMSLRSALTKVNSVFPFKRAAFAVDDHAVFAILLTLKREG